MGELNLILKPFTAGTALAKIPGLTPGQLVNEMVTSGIKGRGGAGFPTGLKWGFASKAQGDQKYIICNADEGEPGTFKDRLLLDEHLPALIEGMTLAGYAVGATKGYLYIRAEYPALCRKAVEYVREATEKGLLGENVAGKGFAFHIEVRKGAGAYVCGEESALFCSIEGKRGEPVVKPPFPPSVGIWGKPTVINNVETLCAVPHIVLNGGSWYAGYGNEFSKGSKVFSVSGDVDNPGIFEVELGKTTIEELLAMAGTDIDEVKAVSMGGVSGRLLPNTELTKPICYRNGYVGGGAVIVYGWDRWIADILLNISEFFEEESCGQCTPCRLGTAQMVEGLEQICDGRGNSKLLATLTELAEVMADSSKCGLGQSAPTPFLDAIKYFKDEILGWEV